YAGIFSTTDLGLPVTGKTATTAMWSGQFQTGEANAVAFDLEVTFGMVAGIPNSVGGIAAFIPSGNDHYLLSGTFDASGLIRGEVNFGEFMADTRTPTASRGANGFLTGIIGSNGAVGAFLSGTAISPDGVITAGTGATGYAGGFVASPFAGNASYRTWVGSANPPATPASAPSGGNLNQFVQSIGNDVISAAHIGQGFNVNLGSLNGDPADGFNVYHITATDDYLVGLSSSTSVGVPLASAPAAAWDGSFVVYENGVATTTAFKLNIDFSAEKLSATIGNYSFGTNVSFQSSGLFRGDINRTTPSSTGNLQGIIGAEGAVGVFHSDSNVTDSFAGGFVAVPALCVLADNCVANHAAWVDSFGASPPPATRPADRATPFGGFLNLASDVRTISDTGFEANTVVKGTLTLDGDGTNGEHGVTYLGGGDAANNRQAFGAVLPTTNLGAPLARAPIITTWPGKYHNLIFGNTQEANFEINFGRKTITATPEDTTTTITHFALGFTDTGIITGTVSRDGSGTAIARGLIGEEGLVGVYVDTTTGRSTGDSIFFGGFIADNPNN
ncbi:MAG: hypothetical protein K8953_11130, partial [Proteobacteria bacterium]|nr:hypothetical protein [Pseudomonadota bacterium]